MTLDAFKQMASRHLQGNWMIAILAAHIVNIITQGPTLLTQYVPFDNVYLTAIPLIGLIFLLPFQVGLKRVFLDFSEEKTPSIDPVFSGFRDKRYLINLGTMLLVGLFTFLWSLILIIPGLIKTFSYAMTPYILADPKYTTLSPTEAIDFSRSIMKGSKLMLLGIQIYYTWWYVLSIMVAATFLVIGAVDIALSVQGIALAIFSFYTTPKMQMVIAELYQSILPLQPDSEPLEQDQPTVLDDDASVIEEIVTDSLDE